MFNYLIFTVFIYILSYALYIKLSHGLGHKAEYLQLRRFIPCAILAVLPLYLSSLQLTEPFFIISCIVGFSWIIVYPLLYYLTFNNVSPDFSFHFDTVFGMYVIGWLTSLKLLIVYHNIFPYLSIIIISLFELCLTLIPVCQVLYYYTYRTCIDFNIATIILETYTNEVIEYYSSLSSSIKLFTITLFILLASLISYTNLQFVSTVHVNMNHRWLLVFEFLFLSYYLWTLNKGVFIRTGLINLLLEVKDYLKQTTAYRTNLEKRIEKLRVQLKVPLSNKPISYILVIGESSSRDYIHAFGNFNINNSPWLSELSKSQNCILFPNAYSCHHQTVPVLEKALTEANQYNNKKFYESCSIVDIAKKAGFKVSWFSNQSHIGSADTAVTLIANTSDVAEWTVLHLNQPQYDETLLDYLKKVNPNENNFIVLHLKGSHFNFINRYPQNFAKFSKPNKYNLISNYIDSICYTDSILKQVKEYAEKNLGLQALVYYSDHATTPDRRRSPKFNGFANIRIPLFVYMADSYIHSHKSVYSNLKDNQNKYWTNDLAYELICGILDIESNHYKEESSLASENYMFTPEMLKSINGQIDIINDK